MIATIDQIAELAATAIEFVMLLVIVVGSVLAILQSQKIRCLPDSEFFWLVSPAGFEPATY